jgi:hypothetical protein
MQLELRVVTAAIAVVTGRVRLRAKYINIE